MKPDTEPIRFEKSNFLMVSEWLQLPTSHKSSVWCFSQPVLFPQRCMPGTTKLMLEWAVLPRFLTLLFKRLVETYQWSGRSTTLVIQLITIKPWRPKEPTEESNFLVVFFGWTIWPAHFLEFGRTLLRWNQWWRRNSAMFCAVSKVKLEMADAGIIYYCETIWALAKFVWVFSMFF